jgi:hypothetical protein
MAFHSTDQGATWNPIIYPPGRPINVADLIAAPNPTGGTNVFVVGANGLYVSTNSGATWNSRTAGLPDSIVMSVGVAGTDIYVGTMNDGVWRRPLNQVLTDVKQPVSSAVPTEFRLEQNYPNPFNPTTKIAYTVPSTAGRNPYAESGNQEVGLLLSAYRIRLTVYDLLGREVAVLVNEAKQPGQYEVSFDGSNLASGTYLCRFTAGDFVQARKLVLLK